MGIKETARSFGKVAPGVALVGLLTFAGCRADNDAQVTPDTNVTPPASTEIVPEKNIREMVDLQSQILPFKMVLPRDWSIIQVTPDEQWYVFPAKKNTELSKLLTTIGITIRMLDKSANRNASPEDLKNQQLFIWSNTSVTLRNGKILKGRTTENKNRQTIDGHGTLRVDSELVDEEEKTVFAKFVTYTFEDKKTNTLWTIRFEAGSNKFEEEYPIFEETLATFHLTGKE